EPVVRPAGTGVDGEDDDGLAVDVAVELLAELLGLRLAGALEVLADEAHLLGVGVVGVEGDDRYAGLVGLADDRLEGVAGGGRHGEPVHGLLLDERLDLGDLLGRVTAGRADQGDVGAELLAGLPHARADRGGEGEGRVVVAQLDAHRLVVVEPLLDVRGELERAVGGAAGVGRGDGAAGAEGQGRDGGRHGDEGSAEGARGHRGSLGCATRAGRGGGRNAPAVARTGWEAAAAGQARDLRLRCQVSAATAATMTRPVTTVCQKDEMPLMLRMFWSRPMKATPMTVPHIVPDPPKRAAPPMMTAEMTVSSRPWPVTPCT